MAPAHFQTECVQRFLAVTQLVVNLLLQVFSREPPFRFREEFRAPTVVRKSPKNEPAVGRQVYGDFGFWSVPGLVRPALGCVGLDAVGVLPPRIGLLLERERPALRPRKAAMVLGIAQKHEPTSRKVSPLIALALSREKATLPVRRHRTIPCDNPRSSTAHVGAACAARRPE